MSTNTTTKDSGACCCSCHYRLPRPSHADPCGGLPFTDHQCQLEQVLEQLRLLSEGLKAATTSFESSQNQVTRLSQELILTREQVSDVSANLELMRQEAKQSAATAALQDLCLCRFTSSVAEVKEMVEKGAEVVRARRAASSPLHHWTREGCLGLVKALLQTPNPINFRTVDEEGNTPFHSVLCGPTKSAELVRELMSVLVARLERRLGDTGEYDDESGLTLWEVKNAAGMTILHLSALTRHLSVVYPLIEHRPYYADRLTPIPLEVAPSGEDWAMLSILQKRRLQRIERTLYDEVRTALPDMKVVRCCVTEGADILHKPREEESPTLHCCILNGNAAALTILLETAGVIDFTVGSTRSLTALHCIFFVAGAKAHRQHVMKAMVEGIVRRLDTHPMDRVDWGAKDEDGRDFLSLAAREGVLSDLYPLVKDQPYYVNAAKPVEILYVPRSEDWKRLGDVERGELQVPGQEEDGTRRLYDEVGKSNPDIGVVRAYLAAGISFNQKPARAQMTALHQCLRNGKLEVLELLLETPGSVDFTVKGFLGMTPLHCVCDHLASQPSKASDVIKAMTDTIVRRLAAHPMDRVDWGLMDKKGRDFLSLAAREGVLSLLYPLVKYQDYYVTAEKPLALTYRPPADDWGRLSAVDGCQLQRPSEEEDMNRRLNDEMVSPKAADLSVVRRCVGHGADVLYKPHHAKFPILHWTIMAGDVDALEALLDTARCVDFTMEAIPEELTPLHCICGWFPGQLRKTAAVMKAMTAAIVNRLAAHPNDRIKWFQKNVLKTDFLSCAAREGVLSDLYPLVKHQEAYVNAAKPLVLAYRPTDDDWAALSDADRSELQVPSEQEDSTRRLYDEVVNSKQPDVAFVRRCVRRGADILHKPRNAKFAILPWCIMNGDVAVLKALLETPRDVDFTVKGYWEQTPLHCVCDRFTNQPPSAKTPAAMMAMTAAIVKRLAEHPNDRVDWGMRNKDDYGFLSFAAKEGVLSDLYSLVKRQPYYVRAAKPLELTFRPSDDDWGLLTPQDRSELQVPSVEDDSTRRLLDEGKKSTPKLDMIRWCVNRGADVTYKAAGTKFPILHLCALRGQAEILQVLLETPRPIDFTVRGYWDMTPLHCVCDHFTSHPPKSPDAMKAMTAAIVNRLNSHPGDKVDWGMRDKEGYDFLSYATKEGVLCALHPLVKDQPYYANATKPIMVPMKASDMRKFDAYWDRLDKDGRSRLAPILMEKEAKCRAM